MKALVTGANGHIGCHVVRSCLAQGLTPIAFVRENADRRALKGLDVEVRAGDLRDAASVTRAAAGTELIFHVGAVHRNFTPSDDDFMGPAVEGTRHVLDAARAHGIGRVVVTSTGATIGFTADPTKPLDESSTFETPESPYIRAKLAAERLALAANRPGTLEVLTVNPSGVFGPRDYRLTPSSRGLVGALQGDPAMFSLCLTDVADVGDCHVHAAKKGVGGERYLATGQLVNPKELQGLFVRLAGVKPPVLRPPRFLLMFLAGRNEKQARAGGADAPLTRAMVRDVYGKHLAYSSAKARAQLGASFRPGDEVLRRSFRWLLFMDALKPKVAAKVRATLGPEAAPDADW